ncbi:MAG: hypothetical protein WAV90_19240 [Gordonia amarae]
MAFVFIQNGGYCEWYLHVHDTRTAADKHRASCHRASYSTSDTVEVPEGIDFDALTARVEDGRIGDDDWTEARAVLKCAAAGVVLD